MLLYHSCTDLPVCSSDRAFTPTVRCFILHVSSFKGSWIEFATDINNVMYAYIDRKKKLPVTTLLRAIGFETDKDILQIFDLAEEVKVNKKNMKDAIGVSLLRGSEELERGLR